MSIASKLEITFSCGVCGETMILEAEDIKPKKMFGNEVDTAKMRLIKKAMNIGWLFEEKNCYCQSCRVDQCLN
jgi:predicted amino acid dehydrogenase